MKTLAAIAVLALAGCAQKPMPPFPAIDLTVRPVLGMVYWVKPPHQNISVYLNSLFNTPGAEGVCVYLAESHYTVYSPIKLPARGCLIGVPMVYYEATSGYADEPTIEVQP